MELNFNSVEMLAAFYVDSGKLFKDDVDICPVIIDKKLKQKMNDFLLVLTVLQKIKQNEPSPLFEIGYFMHSFNSS